MFCTFSPASTTPRRAPRRPATVSTLDLMVDTIREANGARACATEDDLRCAGFTKAEIALHGETAVAKARKLDLAAAA